MTDTNDVNDRTLSTNNSILIPVSTDKVPILWDGNDANILGLLYETGRYYTNKGIFQTLLRDRAVSLSNGKLAIEHPSAVYFVTGELNDPHDFDDPCPPTVERLQQHNDEVDLGTRAGDKKAALTSIPADNKDTVIIAKHCVEKEDATLLSSLTYVFGQTETSDLLLEQSSGSGLRLLELLRDRGNNASATDTALATTKFHNLIRNGVNGELTLETFNLFLKKYKGARRNIAPASRPPASAEIEMVSIIAIKDKDSRELYQLKSVQKPPKTLDEASEILIGMLRGRRRCEEIDELESDSKGFSLAASRMPSGLKPLKPASHKPDATVISALAAAGLDIAALSPEHMKALVTALAPADPRLNNAGKEKVVVPRGPDNRPLKWVEGMATCRCKINGGKHLFRDCPKAKEKAEKKAALAAAASATGAAAAPSEEQLRALLAALFTSAVPAVNLTEGATTADA